MACPRHLQVGALWLSSAPASLYLLGRVLLMCLGRLQFLLSSSIYRGSGFGDDTRLLESDPCVNVGGLLTSCVSLGKVPYLSMPTFLIPPSGVIIELTLQNLLMAK